MSEPKTPYYPVPRDAYLAYRFTHNRYCYLYTREVKSETLWIVVCPEFALREGSVTLCSEPALSPDKMWSIMGQPDVLLNAGFFGTSTGSSIWNLKCDGEIISQSPPLRDIGLGFTDQGTLTSGAFNEGQGWQSYVTVYPELISQGQRTDCRGASDIDYPAYRTSVGWTEADDELNLCRTLFFIVSSAKITLSELQDLILDLFPTTEWAGNLDGGGSSYLKWDGVRFHPSPAVSWLRPVDSVLGLWFKSTEEIEKDFEPEPEPESKIRYTVQLGAFTNLTYAENYLKQIQSLRTSIHDYHDAYLTKQNKYWKIQCGSFSKRENAERMSEDLTEQGYVNYIRTKVLET